MCGLVGIVGTSPVNQRLYDALTVLQHRGQDAAGRLQSVVGYQRLAGRRDGALVHSAVEHSAVLHAAETHAARGGAQTAGPRRGGGESDRIDECDPIGGAAQKLRHASRIL